MASVFIEDGFTVTNEFPKQGWMSAFKFRFRPAAPDRVNRYSFETDAKPAELQKLNVALIIEHVDFWDVKDSKGADVPITEKTLAKIAIPAQRFMVNCVLGYGPDAINLEDAEKN